MIAPLRQSETVVSETEHRLRQARRMIAQRLLGRDPRAEPPAPFVPAWHAWMFTIWVLAVTIAYLAALVGGMASWQSP